MVAAMRLYDYPASGNCYKVRLLLALLDLEYERHSVDIFAGDTLTAAYGRLNPARETPVLELDDGTVLTQSNAILWFLAEGTALAGHDRLTRARIVQWLSFEQEWIMKGVGSARFWTLTGRNPDQLQARRESGREALAFLEAHLATTPYAAGPELTIADISLFAYSHVAPDAGLELAPYPAILAWIQRVEALPRFMDDFVRYPDNARPGAGTSTYG
jgi:glutathione S-transferase